MALMASSISSCVGGSATTGTFLEAPLGTQDIDEIIPFKTRGTRCCWKQGEGGSPKEACAGKREREQAAGACVAAAGKLCTRVMMMAAAAFAERRS
jgi:hypothetical protein